METLQSHKTISKPICAKEDRNHPPSVAKQSCWFHPEGELPPLPAAPFLLVYNLSSMNIAGSEIVTLKSHVVYDEH